MVIPETTGALHMQHSSTSSAHLEQQVAGYGMKSMFARSDMHTEHLPVLLSSSGSGPLDCFCGNGVDAAHDGNPLLVPGFCIRVCTIIINANDVFSVPCFDCYRVAAGHCK